MGNLGSVPTASRYSRLASRKEETKDVSKNETKAGRKLAASPAAKKPSKVTTVKDTAAKSPAAKKAAPAKKPAPAKNASASGAKKTAVVKKTGSTTNDTPTTGTHSSKPGPKKKTGVASSTIPAAPVNTSKTAKKKPVSSTAAPTTTSDTTTSKATKAEKSSVTTKKVQSLFPTDAEIDAASKLLPLEDFDDSAASQDLEGIEDLDDTSAFRDSVLPTDVVTPRRVAQPVLDFDDAENAPALESAFLLGFEDDIYNENGEDDEDRDEDEDDDESDAGMLEELSNPTRTGLRNSLQDVPLTSADYNDRNQELFAKRIEILVDIDVLETKKKLTPGQAEELRRAKFTLDETTRQIIEFNYGLVLNYVRKFTSTTTKDDSADFEAAGVVGLMRAVSSYDPTRGTKFSTWAYKPIQREILKAVRDADFKQLNPGDFEKRPEILRAVKLLQNGDEEHIPSFESVAVTAGATLDAVKRILNAPVLESLSTPMGEDGDTSLTDMIEDPSAGVEDMALARQEIMDLEQFGLSCLDERELFVIGRRFGLDGEPPQRLSAIGTLLGLSREAVRQVEAKALSKLLHPVTRRRLVRHGRR